MLFGRTRNFFVLRVPIREYLVTFGEGEVEIFTVLRERASILQLNALLYSI